MWFSIALSCSASQTAAPADVPAQPAVTTAPAAPPPEPEPEPCPKTAAELVASHPQVDPDDKRLSTGGLIVIRKAERRILHFSDGDLLDDSCWPIGLGFSPEHHKRQEGDGRTPEGWYRTSDKPWSQYYSAIAIHYPNEADALAAEEDGRIDAATRQRIVHALQRGDKPPQTTPMGGEILIHGGGSSSDWTLGCVAMENDSIDRMRAQMPAGMHTDVLILP